MNTAARHHIVILVDSTVRDLPQAALIAHHLEAAGITAHLEPLEAYRGVLAAYRPDLILFNHLTAKHLADYSQRLARMGVLTAVLPNEGIMYDPDDLRFSAGKFHSGAHIDLFFCWNKPHQQALRQTGFWDDTHIAAVGVPRFDFYFEPWSRLYRHPQSVSQPRPRLLLCTNFVTAKYHELPPEYGDRFFAPWRDRIPLYRDYWPAIEAHHKGRSRIHEFIRPILDDGRFDLTVRPHPREDASFYQELASTLPPNQRALFTLDPSSNITELILDCDLEISIETCTTAMESWIACKPTLEIDLEKHPLWHMREPAVCSLACDDPNEMIPAIDQALAQPVPTELAALRRAHLEKWCATPDGKSCKRLAQLIAEAVTNKKPCDWTQLTLNDHRRALKLKAARSLGKAYHFDPFMPIKRALRPKRYIGKVLTYRKSIKPADVKAARRKLEKAATARQL